MIDALEKNLVIEMNIVLTCTFDHIRLHPTTISHWLIPLIIGPRHVKV